MPPTSPRTPIESIRAARAAIEGFDTFERAQLTTAERSELESAVMSLGDTVGRTLAIVRHPRAVTDDPKPTTTRRDRLVKAIRKALGFSYP